MRGRPPVSLKDRLLSRYEITQVSDQYPNCWEYTKSKMRHGYGQISEGCRGGRTLSAHRASWLVHNGEVPEGMQVLHHCDNPPCINPEHLFLGTQPDNMKDMKEKGRCKSKGSRGEAGGKSSLTNSTVIEIRNSYAAGGVTLLQLSEKYGTSESNICSIVNRKTWTHI